MYLLAMELCKDTNLSYQITLLWVKVPCALGLMSFMKFINPTSHGGFPNHFIYLLIISFNSIFLFIFHIWKNCFLFSSKNWISGGFMWYICSCSNVACKMVGLRAKSRVRNRICLERNGWEKTKYSNLLNVWSQNANNFI